MPDVVYPITLITNLKNAIAHSKQYVCIQEVTSAPLIDLRTISYQITQGSNVTSKMVGRSFGIFGCSLVKKKHG